MSVTEVTEHSNTELRLKSVEVPVRTPVRIH